MLKRKSIFLLPFLVFVGWVTSCTKAKQGLDPTQQHTAVISLGINSLRSHGEDTENPGFTDPNTDPSEREDVIKELRLILFPSGGANAAMNMKFDEAGIVNGRVTFRMSELRTYDVYLLANESASGQSATDLAFLSQAGISRNQLESFANVKMVGITPEQVGSGVENYFMMTAVYKNVVFSRTLPGSGTQADPHRIDLQSQNVMQRPQIQGQDRQSAEMMRSLAKMEITLKDVVEVVVGEDGSKTYSWILPYGYTPNSRLKVELLNMPAKYTLFPRKQLTNPAIVGAAQGYTFSFQGAPQEAYVVLPPNIDDASIGGILTADYRLYVYLPEYLASQTLPEQQRPGVKITYSEENVANPKSRFYPIRNAGATHYDTVLGDLDHSKDWSVFRNRFYKMKVNIQGIAFV